MVTVITLKLKKHLDTLGYTPVGTVPNKYKEGFICWKYEDDGKINDIIKSFKNK